MYLGSTRFRFRFIQRGHKLFMSMISFTGCLWSKEMTIAVFEIILRIVVLPHQFSPKAPPSEVLLTQPKHLNPWAKHS